MEKWEYLWHEGEFGLDALGAEGWEAVNFAYTRDGYTNILLKRRIVAEPVAAEDPVA